MVYCPKDIWEWLRDIREELKGLMGKVTKMEFTWITVTGSKKINTISYYENANKLLTISFVWNSSTGDLERIEKS